MLVSDLNLKLLEFCWVQLNVANDVSKHLNSLGRVTLVSLNSVASVLSIGVTLIDGSHILNRGGKIGLGHRVGSFLTHQLKEVRNSSGLH